MAFQDLRSFIRRLEEEGELHRVKAEVDWDLELSHIAKINEQKQGPALLFENVKGYSSPVFTSALATARRLALALDLPGEMSLMQIAQQWANRVRSKIPPREVRTGPCKENIDLGDKVNILKFPVPKYYENDGGRYIGTTHCIISKSPESGWINVGTHRMQVLDQRSAGIWMIPGKHIQLHLKEYERLGKPMPVAVAIGVDPIAFLVSSAPFPPGECEYDFMGALRGEPVEVVKAETVDIPVPAAAEVILEGEVDPVDLKPEGPYGEYSGYYQASWPKPYMKIKCVTYRNNPIHWGCTTGRPITDIHMLMSLNRTAQLWADLTSIGIPGLKGVYCPPETGGYFTAIVSIRQLYAGHARQVGTAVLSCPSGTYSTKLVVVVDEDVDPTDLSQVWWAIGMRFQPNRGTEILNRGLSSHIDPSLHIDQKDYTSRMIIDATIPFEWSEEKRPRLIHLTEDVVERVKRRWSEYFPDQHR
ncbi:MAG: phenylphosphate carboxylase subunit beta [Thermodesulfobacteriota bacterium]